MLTDKEKDNQDYKITKLKELIDKLSLEPHSVHSTEVIPSNNASSHLEELSTVNNPDEIMEIKPKRSKRASAVSGRRRFINKKSDDNSNAIEPRFATAEQVYNYALNLLTFRDYSRAEMYSKLLQKGAEENFAQLTVSKLLEYNFLNEERYAFRVYEMWLGKRVYGRAHLKAEMIKRQIAPEFMAMVLSAFTSEMEEERAEAAAELFWQQNRKKIQELEKLNQAEQSVKLDVFDEQFGVLKLPKQKQRKGSAWNIGGYGISGERMVALKKLQSAAGRFMAARGFSSGYMHILLEKIRYDNDI